ncbi:hypothetical protein LH464_05465 [Neorhizobium sp. T786]|uniref:hypothetical protein n=1 Tax=Pseudorhizobium xiangyangii TaxID=2883104 RepID=UPI001CFFA5DF|nr:hypothetical protein [Neorhizobium xiangyangii]MCB5201925.1 hypothetical protein [Neorhizobium xiangyangii]
MMPDSARHFQGLPLPLLMATGLMLASLSGCSTSKATDSAEVQVAGDSPSKKAGHTRSGKTASSGYVDPALVSASSAAQTSGRAADDSGTSNATTSPGEAMGQGVVTQPTGIRAGSMSIFSNAAPPAPEPPVAETTAAPAAPGRVDARTGSVFSAPSVPQGCGTDGLGYPISC